jgi:hypothetical protein
MTSDFECLLCHAVHTEPSTGDSSGAWRCNRCGQHWDAARLATVIEYQRWAKAEAATIAHAASA